ncbi:MAG: hypothetical protein HY080_12330 [Gammaproteobacteria bacterium]|nr:hypothetical protein [Gammaproteobacteria bacterium]
MYKSDYWDNVCGDDIPSQLVAYRFLDTCVALGVRSLCF